MIISNVIGGLGNQMFQFACGHALALRSGQQLRFSVDMFAGYSLHQGLEIDRVLQLALPRADATDLRACLGPLRTHPQMRRLLARWPLRGLSTGCFIAEQSDTLAEELDAAAARGSVYLHGYWQSEDFFADQAESVRAALKWRKAQGPNADLNNDWARRIQAAPTSVSLHVRRGDYVASAKNQAIYASCSAAYYDAALKRIQALTQADRLQIFAFSDDPSWVRETLAHRWPGLQLIEHNRGAESHQDMRLMSLCRHHVIANSSFSWWGAWLNPHADKVVIAPQAWYASGRDSSRLVPRHWARL